MSELTWSTTPALEGSIVTGDAALVEGCRQKNPEAFARLIGLHERMVYNLAARLLGDPEEAKDMAQDVFLHVFHNIGGFEGRSSLKTWIYRIVVNQCANRRRLWGRRHRSASVDLDALGGRDEAALSTPDSDSPEACCSRREEAALVQRGLGELSYEHRVILLLREAEDLSCEEIGQTLRLPVGTVKSRLSRARDALRRAMQQMEGAPA